MCTHKKYSCVIYAQQHRLAIADLPGPLILYFCITCSNNGDIFCRKNFLLVSVAEQDSLRIQPGQLRMKASNGTCNVVHWTIGHLQY